MSGVAFYVSTAEIELTAATALTVVELTAAANHRVHVWAASFFFDGVAVDGAPVVVELIRIGTPGTGSPGTPVKVMPDDSETLQADFKYDMSAEPTGITVLKRYNIHPQSGYEFVLPIERPVPVPGGDLLGLRMTAPATVNVIVNLDCEE